MRGEILRSRMLSGGSGRARVSYSFEVAYRYVVDGRPHEGDRLSLDKPLLMISKEEAEGLCARYRAGAKGTIHVHPTNPARALLQHPTGLGWAVLALLGAVCLAATVTSVLVDGLAP
ncbi:MAG: DUF3592 domain-containing protein [Betaproteobacteria bacterium]